MKLKKIITILPILLLLLLLLCGCSVMEKLSPTPTPTATPEPTPTASPTPSPTPEPTPSPTPSPTPEPTPYDITGNGIVDEVDELALEMYLAGDLPDLAAVPALLENSILGERYFDRFSYTGEKRGDDFYRNELVSMEFTSISEKELTYYVAEIYVRDLSCFRTALANDTFRRWGCEPVVDMAARTNAVIAVSGDYCTARTEGLCVRNGVWYRETVDRRRDACVLYFDGTMETLEPKEIVLKDLKARGVYQAWSFGPELLDEEGKVKETFRSDVKGANPRSAIGYYEPGHYCLVLVEGREVNGSMGLDMWELAELFESFGCTKAYNFDGGATAIMADANGAISTQSKSRECADIVYLSAVPGVLDESTEE